MQLNVQCHRVKSPLARSVVIFRSAVLIEEVKILDDIMDVLPSGGIFRELQVVHDTGYFPTQGQPSFEEDWHQVRGALYITLHTLVSKWGAVTRVIRTLQA